MELYQQDRHELLTKLDWDAQKFDEYCNYILGQTCLKYSSENLWPIHQLDVDKGDIPQRGFTDFYYGAAGILWALDYWKFQFNFDPSKEYFSLMSSPGFEGDGKISFFFDKFAFLLFKEKLTPSEKNRAELDELLSSISTDDKNEILFGTPGTMLGVYYLIKLSGDQRFYEHFQRLKRMVLEAWELDNESHCHMWSQNFSGSFKLVGAAHGTFGNIQVLLRTKELLSEEEIKLINSRSSEAFQKLSIETGECANWPKLRGDSNHMLLHWCHGAPGVICDLADYLPRYEKNDELLVKAGNLIWEAGPLKKGTSICHGTTGNALAFLKLHKRFKDDLWLERAKAFAMHALKQCQELEKQHGQLRYSLWTGDLGLVWLNMQIKNNTADLPMLDVY